MLNNTMGDAEDKSEKYWALHTIIPYMTFNTKTEFKRNIDPLAQHTSDNKWVTMQMNKG